MRGKQNYPKYTNPQEQLRQDKTWQQNLTILGLHS